MLEVGKLPHMPRDVRRLFFQAINSVFLKMPLRETFCSIELTIVQFPLHDCQGERITSMRRCGFQLRLSVCVVASKFCCLGLTEIMRTQILPQIVVELEAGSPSGIYTVHSAFKKP